MQRLLIIVICCLSVGIAWSQTGVSTLSGGKIGLSAFNPVFIGQSTTPACKWPQSCGGQPACPVYTFIGKGDWRIPGNWEYGIMPPAILPPCFKILINPSGNEKCVLPTPQILMPGSSFYVEPGKQIVIPGHVKQQD